MIDFYGLRLFGAPFEHVETYFEYEGIRTFAMRSTRLPLFYIGNCVDENDDEDTLTFLFATMGPERFNAVRSGLVSFRDVFADSMVDGHYVVTWDFSKEDLSSPTIQVVGSNDIPQGWLPAADARLKLKTDTTVEYSPAELSRISADQRRSVFAIEVESSSNNITEFPTKYSGRLQTAVQGQIDALAQEYTGASLSDVQTTVIGLRAASFVIVLAVDSGHALFERQDVTREVFSQFQSLVAVAASEDSRAMIDALSAHSRRVRLRFRDLLEPLVKTGSGLALDTALVGAEEISSTRMTAKSAARAFNALESVTPIVENLRLSRAILTGLTLRTKRFEIVDAASMKIYKGAMTDEALNQADGLTVSNSSFVSAVIRIEVSFAGEDSDSEAKYFLESIEAISKR